MNIDVLPYKRRNKKVIMDNKALTRFFYWMHERHAIYLKRKAGLSWPWSDDPILQTFKFTNVFRELDAGTVWCRENIRGPYTDHPELFFNIAVYRRHNLIATGEALGFIEHYNPIWAMEKMYERRAQGKAIFTGAHMTCGTIRDANGNIPPDKIIQIFGIAFEHLWQIRHEIEPQPGDTLQTAYERMLKMHPPGYGAFITYEVITDLRWTRYLQDAYDTHMWANPGPGAKRGIQRLYGQQDAKGLSFSYNDYVDIMRWLMKSFNKGKLEWMPSVEMRDIEHSLCEFDKYMRVLLGQGRPRQKFTPPHLRK